MTMGRFVRTFLWCLGLQVVVMGTAVALFAGPVDASVSSVPEIDAGTLGSAVAVLAGGYLVLLSRFRRK